MSLLGRIKRYFLPGPGAPESPWIVQPKAASQLRGEEWRKQTDLVKIARKFLDDPEFQTLLNVLENDHPCKIVLIGKVSVEERAVFQARIEGYEMALQTLKMLGVFDEPKQEIHEDTYIDEFGANVPERKRKPRLKFGEVPA